jgi:hypothetical protein
MKNKISGIIDKVNLKPFELIFVDNSMDIFERIKTINKISEKNCSNKIVIIHDFEYYPYREACKNFKFRFRFKSLNPNTGVLWNNNKLDINKLKKIENLIKSLQNKTSIKSYNKFLLSEKFKNQLNLIVKYD